MMCPFQLPEEEACLDLPYIALLEEVGQLQVRRRGRPVLHCSARGNRTIPGKEEGEACLDLLYIAMLEEVGQLQASSYLPPSMI